MKKIFYSALITLSIVSFANAQQRQGQGGTRPTGTTTTPAATTPAVGVKADVPKINSNIDSRMLVPESAVITNHAVTIKGKSVAYKATAGTMPVWDEDGKPIAGLFYTFY